MIKLTDEQKKWWNRLLELYAIYSEGHLAVRMLALEILKNQPYQDKIVFRGVAQDQIRVQFGQGCQFNTKDEYIHFHSRPGVWGDDSILYPLLQTLGYQPVIYINNSSVEPYKPFTQSVKTGLTIEIVNYGADKGGLHWERKGQRNIGGGNCMYHAVNQQIQLDIPEIKKQLFFTEEKKPPLSTKKILHALADKSKPISEDEIIKHQQALIARYYKGPSPTEQDREKESVRISKLSPQEQQQIEDDNKFALRLAREEMRRMKN